VTILIPRSRLQNRGRAAAKNLAPWAGDPDSAGGFVGEGSDAWVVSAASE
jgi:hypothetical protein